MRSTSKLAYTSLLSLALTITSIPMAYSYGLRASYIYIQAKNNNTQLLKLLQRHEGIIDIPNEYGQTAYCLALRYNDSKTASLLKSYGANKKHKCVNEVKQAKTSPDGVAKIQRFKTAPENKPKYKNDGNSYLWWGGAAVVATGAGLALSGGGGGGGSNTSLTSNNTNNSNNNNNANENHGSNNAQLTSLPKEYFMSGEYNKSNYLKSINAAEAYSRIYSLNAKGELVSHQANSSNELDQVKVGIIDTGVGKNNDLSGKITKIYDINEYNTKGNLYGAIKGNIELYVLKEGDNYYSAIYEYNGDNSQKAIDTYPSSGSPLTKDELSDLINFVNNKYGTNFKGTELEIMNGSNTSPGTNLSTNDKKPILTYKIADQLNHGSHVAGIITGNKNDEGGHGVAFDNASLYVASWDMQQNLYSTVVDMVDNGVQVINNSWGYTNEDASQIDKFGNKALLSAYAYAAKNDVVWVQATGNESRSQPGISVGMDLYEDLSKYGYDKKTELDKDPITGVIIEVPQLAVAMLDGSKTYDSAPNGRIHEYSNRCGVTSSYCISTEGTNVLSTSALSSGSVAMTGTSMATPVVTGSIALLKGYYPWLKATNISYLLLETAYSGGEYSEEKIYGQGVLDLNAAITTPLGGLRLPEKANLSSLTLASQSKLALSAPLQAQFLKSMPQTITAFDILNRPFEYSTQNLINTTHSSQASLKNAVSKLALGNSKKTIKDENSGYSFSSSYSMDNSGNSHLSEVEVTTSSDTSSTRFYYQENSKYDGIDNLLQSSNNPYLAMNEAYGAENTINLSDTSKLKLSLQTGENGLYERDSEQDKHSFNERAYSMNAQYSFNTTDYLTMSLMGGLLFEEDALLGLNGMGSLNIQDTSTYYMGLHASLRLSKNLSLIAAYYRGFTSGSQSAMLSISDLQSESFMLASEYNLNKTDKIGLSLSSPLSIVKGNASIMYATGRDNYSNNAYLQQLKTSLKSPAKEYDLNLYYSNQSKQDLSYQGKITTRFNADGNKGLTDYMGIMGVQYNF